MEKCAVQDTHLEESILQEQNATSAVLRATSWMALTHATVGKMGAGQDTAPPVFVSTAPCPWLLRFNESNRN